MNLRHSIATIFDLSPDKDRLSKTINRSIYALIVLSTVIVIVETIPAFKLQYLPYLYACEIVITIVFCAELVLRCAVLDILVRKHTSAWERFLLFAYFIIDFAAVIPPIVFLLSPDNIHHDYFLTLRLLRIFKAFRHDHSIELILKAVINKRTELLHSAILVFTFTVFLSVLLYEIENDFEFGGGSHTTPFTDIFTTLAWAFSMFVNDAIGYQEAGLLPTTPIGRFIAWIIGFLNIGIVIIPTGIIASGFLEVLEENKIESQYLLLKQAFRKKYNATLGIEIFERPRTLLTLQNALFIEEANFYKILESKQGFRIRAVYSADDEKYNDTNIIEHYAYQDITLYGAMIRRTSAEILILTPNSAAEENIGYFSYCIAELLHAHYISNERYQINALHREFDICFKTSPLLDTDINIDMLIQPTTPRSSSLSHRQDRLQPQQALQAFKCDIQQILLDDPSLRTILVFESEHDMTEHFDITTVDKYSRELPALLRYCIRLRTIRTVQTYLVRISNATLSHYDYYVYIREAAQALHTVLTAPAVSHTRFRPL
ncbi:MAG: ion transporter [Bacteroidota bacterium]|nr:ion transporter [Candidatus Kapabacteria bacterium]MDW8219390.1 ion transporter [Bacteroidota bacterium]